MEAYNLGFKALMKISIGAGLPKTYSQELGYDTLDKSASLPRTLNSFFHIAQASGLLSPSETNFPNKVTLKTSLRTSYSFTDMPPPLTEYLLYASCSRHLMPFFAAISFGSSLVR
nr:unnamed protein product [Callosobruchus chinensis]